jgi:membrane protein DedA with SNARE-associated domain
MAEFWAEWGWLAYVAAAAWAFLEGETFVLLAAAAGEATGFIDPKILTISVWIGSFAGDQTWFALGRRYGVRALRRVPGAEAKLAMASTLLERHGALFVLGFRFVYGVRNVAAAACGAAGMGRLRFAVLNFIAAGLWATSFVAAGWYFAGWIGADGLGRVLVGFGLVVVVLFVIRIVWVRLRRTRAGPAASG